MSSNNEYSNCNFASSTSLADTYFLIKSFSAIFANLRTNKSFGLTNLPEPNRSYNKQLDVLTDFFPGSLKTFWNWHFLEQSVIPLKTSNDSVAVVNFTVDTDKWLSLADIELYQMVVIVLLSITTAAGVVVNRHCTTYSTRPRRRFKSCSCVGTLMRNSSRGPSWKKRFAQIHRPTTSHKLFNVIFIITCSR